MKVLHINQSDISGGAGIAGYRLHQGLLDRGIDSRLLVGNAQTKSDRVATVDRKYRLENQFFRFSRYLGLNYLNLISSFNIPKHKFYQEAEILNFHNLHTGYFNYLTIPNLTKNKPAIFTLHDMWSFTGHCAYSYTCDRWKSGCGKCAYLDTYPSVQKDNTRLEWKLKNWIYSRSNLTVVTPSKWLTEQVTQSLLNRFPIHHIPYGIDTQAYQPLDRELCRKILDIPIKSKVLMFSAQDLTDSRKGSDLLLKALEMLPQSLKAEIVVLTMGKCNTKVLETLGLKILSLGYVESDRLKSVVYSATDLFVFPTRADNLPLVLQESMACATPMVSFKVGGVPDLVRHGITGYLASPEDTQDMSKGIVELLENDDLRQRMSQNCRAIALEEYSLELQAQRYMELYQNALQNQQQTRLIAA